MKSRGDTISHGEMFRRGFYGGFGLWCSFSVLNIAAILLIVLALAWLGIIGTAVDAWSRDTKPRRVMEPDRPPVSRPVTRPVYDPSR